MMEISMLTSQGMNIIKSPVQNYLLKSDEYVQLSEILSDDDERARLVEFSRIMNFIEQDEWQSALTRWNRLSRQAKIHPVGKSLKLAIDQNALIQSAIGVKNDNHIVDSNFRKKTEVS